jgi:hypothetical protein
MLKKEIFDIGMLLMLLAIGCKKSNNGNSNAQDQFPNKVGDEWHYLVKDTTFHPGLNTDTSSVQYNVDVLIVGTVKLANGITATIWQFNYPDHVDTNYVYQSEDTIKFFDHNITYLLGQYIFPFTSGSSWPYLPTITPFPESVSVTGPGVINVGNNEFSGAWRIYGFTGPPDGMFTIDQWFKDYVGFVKKYLDTSGEYTLGNRHNLDWYLESYEIK